jgi:hypothetical protein
MRAILASEFVLLGGVMLLACGDDDDASCDTPEPTLASLHTVVLDPSCALSGSCHNDSKGNPEPIFDGDRDDGSFDVTDPEGICAYIDEPAVTDTESRPLISCGSREDSYIMIKVDPARASEITSSEALLSAQQDTPASGMPQRSRGRTGTPLCQPKIDALCAWIDAGCTGCP